MCLERFNDLFAHSGLFTETLAQSHVHTVTAFSLPAGRSPRRAGLWTFLAFDVRMGLLRQRPLRIIDPQSGVQLATLPVDETVRAPEGDPRLIEQTKNFPTGRRLAERVFDFESRLAAIRPRILNPHRTGVENTSCATCHRFNQQGENFHNLSYFEGAEMTISPRARRDVEHELAWLRQWIKSDGGVFDLEIAGQ